MVTTRHSKMADVGGFLDEPLFALSQSLTADFSTTSSESLPVSVSHNQNHHHLSGPFRRSSSPSTSSSHSSYTVSLSEPLHILPIGCHPNMTLPCQTNLNQSQTITTHSNGLSLTSLGPPASYSTNSPATLCEACHNMICTKIFVQIEGKSFHEGCARCVQCGLPLDDKCYYREGYLFCKKDYMNRYSRICNRCQKPINPQQFIMQVRDAIYHLNCFSCSYCGEQLRQGEKFVYGTNGNIVCYKHADNYMVPSLNPPSSNLNTLDRNIPAPLNSSNNIPLHQTPQGRESRRGVAIKSVSSPDEEERESSPETMSGNPKTKRMRTSFKHHQLREMKRYFQLNHNPDAKDLRGLAQKTGLTKRVLQVWFQNARAKYRRSQAGNPNPTLSPNGCILPRAKFDQCYAVPSSTASTRTSTSPFENHTAVSQSSFSSNTSNTSPVEPQPSQTALSPQP